MQDQNRFTLANNGSAQMHVAASRVSEMISNACTMMQDDTGPVTCQAYLATDAPRFRDILAKQDRRVHFYTESTIAEEGVSLGNWRNGIQRKASPPPRRNTTRSGRRLREESDQSAQDESWVQDGCLSEYVSALVDMLVLSSMQAILVPTFSTYAMLPMLAVAGSGGLLCSAPQSKIGPSVAATYLTQDNRTRRHLPCTRRLPGETTSTAWSTAGEV